MDNVALGEPKLVNVSIALVGCRTISSNQYNYFREGKAWALPSGFRRNNCAYTGLFNIQADKGLLAALLLTEEDENGQDCRNWDLTRWSWTVLSGKWIEYAGSSSESAIKEKKFIRPQARCCFWYNIFYRTHMALEVPGLYPAVFCFANRFKTYSSGSQTWNSSFVMGKNPP